MIANKKQIFKLAGVVLTCAVISACSPSDPTNKTVGNSGTQSFGSADFTKFVAIGDSLTAGYADGALYLLGQQNSFPLMLAQQFAAVDGGDVNFTQPLVDDNLGGLLFGGNPNPDFDNRFVLNTETEKPERLVGTPATEVTNVLTGMFNNMGVPGAKSFHLLSATYGDFTQLPNANPYFIRFAQATTNTVMDDVITQVPSFFTLWIGNNDVLSYATSGGIGVNQTNPLVDPATYSQNDITNTIVFDNVYKGLVATMKGANPAVQGVLVNIPDVSTLPYFTTVPYNAVPLDQASADALNQAYAGYNALLQGLSGTVLTAEEVAQRTISFSAGQNAVVILDEDLSPITNPADPSLNMRQATASDLIVLPTSSKLGTESVTGNPATIWGLGTPLVDADVLIPSEIAAIDTARTAFNATIKTAAGNDSNLAFLDASAIMTQLSTTGVDYGSGNINSEFVRGGAFSLDGVHPTARGYAVIANSIIDVINTSFGANVYKVDPATYPAVLLK